MYKGKCVKSFFFEAGHTSKLIGFSGSTPFLGVTFLRVPEATKKESAGYNLR